MGELAIRVRTLLGSLPVGLEGLGRAAVGSPSSWRWLPPAIPWLVAGGTALGVGATFLGMAETAREFPPLASFAGAATGAAVLLGLGSLVRGGRTLGLIVRLALVAAGALSGGLLGTILTSTIVDAPLAASAVAGLLVGGAVLGWRLQIAHSAHAAATTIGFVPAVISTLIVLALLPVLQAGTEIITAQATVPAFVERQIGFSSSLVAIRGFAILPPFGAEAPVDPEAGTAPGDFHWIALREELGDRRIALVRSAVDPGGLRRREIVARVRDDIDQAAALAALEDRGVAVPDSILSHVLQGLDADAAARAGGARRIGSVAELGGTEPGDLVRLTLDFPGDGVATCVLADRCQARRLARGVGPWLHLARDSAVGTAVIVQLRYPPTVAPVQLYGRQDRDPGAVTRFLDGPQVRLLLGWARVLRGAIIEHDPELPVDRLWLGPILFAALALLLVSGRWSGYPLWQATPLATESWTGGTLSTPLNAIASGRLSPPGRSPTELVDRPITLSRVGTETELTVLGPEALRVQVPRALGALSVLEPGEVRYLRSRRPALRVGWYGSNVRLLFGSTRERDAATALLGGEPSPGEASPDEAPP